MFSLFVFYLMEHKSLYMDYKNQEKKKIVSKHMAIHCVESSGSVKKKNFLYHDAFPNPITRSGGLCLALSNPASHNSKETLLSPACHFNWNIEVGHGRKSISILLSWRNLLWWTDCYLAFCFVYVGFFFFFFGLCEFREMKTGYCLLAKAMNDMYVT